MTTANRKITAAFMCVFIPLAVCAARSYAAGERTKSLFNNILNTRTKPVYMKLKSNINTGGKTSDVTVTMAVKDGNVYTDMDDGSSERISYVQKNGESWIVMHSEKMYMKNYGEEPSAPIGPLDEQTEEGEYDNAPFKSGTEQINGKTYEYDETGDGENRIRFYFEPGTDTWKYMKAGNETVEVIEYGNDVKDSLFSIPPGYAELNFGGF